MEKLENPVTVEYLQANLRKEHPRLGMTPDLEADIRARLETDLLLKNMYEAMKLNTDEILVVWHDVYRHDIDDTGDSSGHGLWDLRVSRISPKRQVSGRHECPVRILLQRRAPRRRWSRDANVLQ